MNVDTTTVRENVYKEETLRVINDNFSRIRVGFQEVVALVRRFYDTTAASQTCALPPVVTNLTKDYVVFKTDATANTVTVLAAGTDTINGAVSVVLNYQYEYVWVTPDYTTRTWKIIGRGTLTPSFDSVTFPATQVPSSDPNTLDDYEEGTWTPSLGGSATYTTRMGTYTKIGRLVHIHCRVAVNVLGTGSTSTITGLPFNPAVLQSGNVSLWFNTSANFVFLNCYVSGSAIDFSSAAAATASLTAPTNLFQDGTEVILSASYYV